MCVIRNTEAVPVGAVIPKESAQLLSGINEAAKSEPAGETKTEVSADALSAWRKRQATATSRVVRAPVASVSVQQNTGSSLNGLSQPAVETAQTKGGDTSNTSTHEEKKDDVSRSLEVVQAKKNPPAPVTDSSSSGASSGSKGDSYEELMAQLEALKSKKNSQSPEA